MRAEGLRQALAWLTYPPVALAVYVVVTWLGHVPAVYETALRSDSWHVVQHLSFLAAALLFWYPVVRPYPSHPSWSPWLLVPYLVLADVQNTVLAALITFSGHVLYPYYDEVPRLAGLSALDDQAAAGVAMWVPGSVAFLLPLFVLGVRLVGGAKPAQSAKRRAGPCRGMPLPCPLRSGLPIVGQPGTSPGSSPALGRAIDLLRIPFLGRLLAGRATHRLLPGLLALLAAALVVDGFYGPQTGAMNLAGVLPWIHWRGVAVFVLLAAGNLVCGACPFTLPRRLLGRLMPAGRPWPAWLGGKWLSVGLLALFLWAYEVFALWDRPAWTAWLAIGYFVAAFTVDSLFRDGTFCKHVCPIGQFNFVHSLLSPLEVRVRRPSVCVACQTKDCLHGRGELPGCSLDLLQPAKAGNFDCTFCLACVRACPQDNVGLLVTPPGRELWLDRSRSGVGRLGRRADLAALVVVLVFGAVANAGAMVGPVVRWQDGWQAWLGASSPWLVTSLMFLVTLGVVPLAGIGLAATLSCRWARLSVGPKELALRFRLVAGAAGIQSLAGTLQLPLLYQFCHGRAGRAAIRGRVGFRRVGPAALGLLLLRPDGCVDRAGGDFVSRLRSARFAVCRVSHRGRLWRNVCPADANRHPLGRTGGAAVCRRASGSCSSRWKCAGRSSRTSHFLWRRVEPAEPEAGQISAARRAGEDRR